jgi:hypothetical protein
MVTLLEFHTQLRILLNPVFDFSDMTAFLVCPR